MAFTNVALVAASGFASVGDPLSVGLASGENIEAGKLGILYLVTDNAATVDGASTTHSAVTDTSGNTWTKLGEHTSTDGSALDGCTVSLWISEIATALTGGIGIGLEVDFTTDPGNDGIGIVFKCDYTGTPTFDTVVHAIDADSAVVSGRTSREYLAIGTHGAEGEGTTYTEDADYTSMAVIRSTGGGANNTNIYGFVGTRIATLTGDTYGPTPPESLNRVTSLWFLWDDPGSSDRVARVTWSEMEVPTAPRLARITWAELETPNGPRLARVTWAELEIPTAPRLARVTWVEMEAPNAPRLARVTWAELEVPSNANDRTAYVTWVEMQAPDAPRLGRVTWAELEIPDAPRLARVTWAEFEIPTAPRVARVTWVEMQAPDAPRLARVTWAEMEISDVEPGEETLYAIIHLHRRF